MLRPEPNDRHLRTTSIVSYFDLSFTEFVPKSAGENKTVLCFGTELVP